MRFIALPGINPFSNLGDSHGYDGRRRLEDGERKRSQIR
jgi:hypothetical protein